MTQINPSRYGSLSTGSRFTLTCIAVKAVDGLTLPAATLWYGPSGTELGTNDSIIVAEATVEPLRTVHAITFTSIATSHAGVYNCETMLFSPALSIPYEAVTSYAVLVTGEFHL